MSDKQVRILSGTEKNNEWIQVGGWRTGVPGLVITKALGVDGWYTVSHLQSGRCMGNYVWPSIAAAKRAAKGLGKLEDWEDHVGRLGSVTGRLLAQVRKVCDEEGIHRFDVMFGETP